MKLVLSLVFLSVFAFANKPATGQKADENNITAQLLEQVLNTINQASLDVNINNITFDSKAQGSKVKTDDVQVNGMISFAGNWEADLIQAENDAEGGSQMKKVYPKMQIDANNLKLAVDIKVTPALTSLQAKFFSNYDQKTKQWMARPLTVRVSNHMNKELLAVRLFSLQVTKTVNSQNPAQSEIVGTCQSDKILLDFTTGKNKQVPVDCKFSGVMTDTGYKIQFKYANK